MFYFHAPPAAAQVAAPHRTEFGTTIQIVTCAERWRMFRLRNFKAEPLLPACPSAYVLLVIPAPPPLKEVPACASLPTEAAAAKKNKKDDHHQEEAKDCDEALRSHVTSLLREIRRLEPSVSDLLGKCHVTAFSSPFNHSTTSLCLLIDTTALGDQKAANFALEFCDHITNRHVALDAATRSSSSSTTAASGDATLNTSPAPVVPASSSTTDASSHHSPSSILLLEGPMFAVLCNPIVDELRNPDEDGDFSPSFWKEYYELPTCLMCLDRLDTLVSGIAHICPCEPRRFNCTCGTKVTPCDVCCHLSNDTASTAAPIPRCFLCGDVDETWSCLVCGNVGCGRYHREHAQSHFKTAHHEFAASVVTQQIWDYTADSFVHRWLLRLDTETGCSEKMALPLGDAAADAVLRKIGAEEGMGGADNGTLHTTTSSSLQSNVTRKTLVDAKIDFKMERLCMDYSRELAAQLEAQRLHYRSLIAAQSSTDAAVDLRPNYSLPLCVEKDVQNLNRALTSANELTRLDMKMRALEATLRELTGESEQLKSQLKLILERRTEINKAVKARTEELRECIQDLEGNLRAQRQLQRQHVDAGTMGVLYYQQQHQHSDSNPKKATKR